MSAFLPAKLHINYGRKKIYGENFWLLHENHYNKVDENAMFQVRAQKKRVCHKSVTHPFFVCVSIYSS